MTVTVTKCPAGFAYGYFPANGSNEMDELRSDTLDVCQGIEVHGLARSGKVSGKTFQKIEHRLSRWRIKE